MPRGEMEAWLHVVEPHDLDAHMRNIGQAAANAEITRELFKKYPLASGSKLLIHGCGTCQMFDYIKPSDIGDVRITFADINESMLELAEKRIKRHKILRYRILRDDIENSKIKEHHDAVLLTLVLLHVNWRESLESIIRLAPSSIYIIEQKQSRGPSVTKERELPSSIRRYTQVAEAELVSLEELKAFLVKRGYVRIYVTGRSVPDKKRMVGLVYRKDSKAFPRS